MHVCRIAGRSAGLWQIMNCGFLFLCVTVKKCCTRCEISKQALYISLACCFFEGGILPSKKETDSKAIYALPSVWISCFPSVGHLLYGYFTCATLKHASFFGSILSKNERKIVPKTACRLNLQVSKTVLTFLCTHWGMNVWREYHTEVYMNVTSYPHLYAFSYIHTYFHSYIRAYAHSKTEYGFLNCLWVSQ